MVHSLIHPAPWATEYGIYVQIGIIVANVAVTWMWLEVAGPKLFLTPRVPLHWLLVWTGSWGSLCGLLVAYLGIGSWLAPGVYFTTAVLLAVAAKLSPESELSDGK